MGRGKFVEFDVEEAARFYRDNRSLAKTATLLGIDDSTLRSRFLRHGVKINPHAGRKMFKLNDQTFESIDSEPKAYWLGFLFADGSVYRGKQGYKLTVRLARKDRHMIERLFAFLGANNPIRDEVAKKKIGKYKKQEYPASCGVVSSKKLVGDLIAHGCVPKKSLILKFPTTVPEGLLRHFIRGYFDGDGCVSLSKKSRTPWNWSLLGTREILEAVRAIFVSSCNLRETKIGCRKKIHCLSYGGRLNVLKISNFLYEGATVWLERKRIKMESSNG